MPSKTKKATFNLHTDLLTELDEIMVEGVATSKNAFVEQALRKELNEIKRQARKNLWQEAIKDPLFIKDIAEVEYDFGTADNETIGSLD